MVGGNSAQLAKIGRLLLGVTLAASIILVPWWVSLIVAVCLALVTERPYEILVFGFLSDLIYADFRPETLDFPFFLLDHFVMTFIMAGIILFSSVLWQRTRWRTIVMRS